MGFGGSDRPAIVLLPPLFDEANRMRRTLVLTMRALAQAGHNCLLPDLPGQGDSMLPTRDATLPLWREALADLAASEPGPLLVASWRGGALIDDAAAHAVGWWRMAPLAGASIVRTMMRTRIAGDKEAGRQTSVDQLRSLAALGPIELAGHSLSAEMIDALEQATPAPLSRLRSVTVGQGEGQIAGSALWLRAEPGEDAAMALAMAKDISAWSIACAAG